MQPCIRAPIGSDKRSVRLTSRGGAHSHGGELLERPSLLACPKERSARGMWRWSPAFRRDITAPEPNPLSHLGVMLIFQKGTRERAP